MQRPHFGSAQFNAYHILKAMDKCQNPTRELQLKTRIPLIQAKIRIKILEEQSLSQLSHFYCNSTRIIIILFNYS